MDKQAASELTEGPLDWAGLSRDPEGGSGLSSPESRYYRAGHTRISGTVVAGQERQTCPPFTGFIPRKRQRPWLGSEEAGLEDGDQA